MGPSGPARRRCSTVLPRVARNVIQDSADQPSYQGGLHFATPWAHLTLVFALVYAAALLTILAPAARAARVYPAEALRYE